ncbi:MAG TPA: tRNA (adenine(22)-N(1))-methyltransferase TrmK [Candidatus Dormibacteraeota bacterium]|nr:tRNA (adenine(22)-N(1))-methyltransferase TrmK [Candidatus Dormibacteraeota bacterium]
MIDRESRRSGRLPARLRAVAEAVPAGAVSVADVGAGDGQLARHLADRGLRVVATERRPASFARLRAALPDLDCRVGEGLAVLRPGEVEGAVVAGLGGHGIIRVLASAPDVARSLEWLVLQPQQHPDRLVAWLQGAGYRVRARTDAVQGGRSYTVLLVIDHERT